VKEVRVPVLGPSSLTLDVQFELLGMALAYSSAHSFFVEYLCPVLYKVSE
jgi:hypothetical protein